MADVNVKFNGQDTTLLDVGDQTITFGPGEYIIRLNSRDARAFVRAEVDDLRAEKAALVLERTALAEEIEKAVATRDNARAEKNNVDVEIDSMNDEIQKFVSWLQSQGD